VTLVLAVVVTVIHLVWPRLSTELVTGFVAPYWRAEFALKSGSLRPTDMLLFENQELKRLLADYEARMESVRFVERENETLKNLFGRASTTDRIVVAVLKRPPLNPYDELIVDGGRDYGFSTTSLVFGAGGVPLGRVFEVMARTSKVRLFSSAGETNEVFIGSENIPARAIGRGGGQYEVELPRNIKVSVDDSAELAEISGPPFARVTKLMSDPASTFQTVLLSSPINIYNLRWVLIGKGE